MAATKRKKVKIDPKEIEKLAPYLKQEQIAGYLGLSVDYLRERFRKEPELNTAYQKGRQRCISEIAESLISKARSGDLGAMIFYLKTQARWSETQKFEHSGPEGQPIQTMKIDYSQASDEQVRKLIEVAEKLIREEEANAGK